MSESVNHAKGATSADSPTLLVPYMWIGDFVRCHSVVKVLQERWPNRPVDVLATTLCAPLADYMPGVRRAIIVDLPRGRLGWRQNRALAERLRSQRYGRTLIMPRTWKSALAPYLAGIPTRTGWAGEARFLLVNDMRWGERKLPRMVDRCAALALPADTPPPAEWPLPELRVPPAEVATWKARMDLNGSAPVVALCPGAVGPSKRWTAAGYRHLVRHLSAEGYAVWVVGGPGERAVAAEIAVGARPHVRDLTGDDLRNAILALAAADAAVSNDSGLLHVAAAAGTPAIGIFGPTSAKLWAPLNPLAAVIETAGALACRPCHKPTCRLQHHRCMRDIAPETVVAATLKAVAATPLQPA